jgi:phosphatidate cytidylyltransferase
MMTSTDNKAMSGTGVRVLTALALGVLGLFVIFALPDYAFVGFTALLSLGLGYEWFRLSAIGLIWRWIALIVAAVLGAGLFLFLPASLVSGLFALAVLGWAGLILGLWFHRRVAAPTRSSNVRTLLGILILPVFWLAVVMIHREEQGPWLLLFGILIVAVADSLAYFAGRAWGKNKLAPALSPGKSIEGMIGGLVGVGMLAAIGAALPLFQAVPSWQLAVWSMLVAIYSVAGDLEESRLKREAGVKDSGRILPGHGGLLDRLDGQLAAMPIWFLALAQMHLFVVA